MHHQSVSASDFSFTLEWCIHIKKTRVVSTEVGYLYQDEYVLVNDKHMDVL